MPDDAIMIPLPGALYRRVEAAAGADEVPAYVARAVREALARDEAAAAPGAVDEAQIVERLRRLGYLD
ncbi:MAG: hypothetical protein QN174_13465 [Armatimonadota bacterium]|nr:hypothetical protein [Armatimonadota bacterium]MDR7423163.1 hypothetical protein [Armatimonadota bacterium]MDR7455570.1 hypothetical protein [Armatimonadota bacterium]MDR7458057.1 hypothetical protein [Armatimonadota bacterium]MDR7497953.1 hypothetical protein [Armatimonadota bacterium]